MALGIESKGHFFFSSLIHKSYGISSGSLAEQLVITIQGGHFVDQLPRYDKRCCKWHNTPKKQKEICTNVQTVKVNNQFLSNVL